MPSLQRMVNLFCWVKAHLLMYTGSFGMLLYVLLNELRFPGSKNYHPNVMQYARGFKAEYPTTGFTWWKLLEVIFLSFAAGFSTGIIGSGMLLMNITFRIMKMNSVGMLREYGWISVQLISLSFFLLFYHYVLGERDEKMTKMYLGKNLYWFVVAAIYALLMPTEISLRTPANPAIDLYERLFGHEVVDNLLELNLKRNMY